MFLSLSEARNVTEIVSICKIGSGDWGAGETWQYTDFPLITFLFHSFRGKIYNTTTDPLNPDDVYYICRVLNDLRMYYKEILWLEEFVAEIEDGYFTGKTHPVRAYKALAGSYSLVIIKFCLEPKILHVLHVISNRIGLGLHIKWHYELA